MRSRVAEVMHNQHDQFPEHDVPVARIDVVASRASGIGTLYLRGKRPDSEQSTTVIAEIASMTASWRRASIALRSEEHTSELQSVMRSSYAVFCLNTKQ